MPKLTNPFRQNTRAWDLSALLNAADGAASLPERHLWLVRLLEWLRHAPLPQQQTPTPVLRLRHLLNVLERHPEHRTQVQAVLSRFWQEVDAAALLADFGFSARMDLAGEIGQRMKMRLLPATPDTRDLAELFNLLFPEASDALWLDALDEPTLQRFVQLITPTDMQVPDWRAPFLDAIMFLSATIRATGFSPSMRARMSAELLVDAPFRQLARVAEDVREHAEAGHREALLQAAGYLRALLDTCRRCADSVHDHLEEHGVSVDLVFELDQLRLRTHRVEELLNCVLSDNPSPDITRLLAHLVRTAEDRRSVRALFARHYSLLARKVAERSAETGEHYITRDRGAYARMLKAAAGGGAVLAYTTIMKFMVIALGLGAFWGGVLAGVNYATSFVFILLMHWTVATKQPAMTALAKKLRDVSNDEAVEGFVDEVAHLIRSQAAGILGNLAMVTPVVLGVQWLCIWIFGKPAVGPAEAEHILSSLSLLGFTPLFAAFTGVLLFTSSIIAGWVENWFVWHRLDSAIAWNPRIVARLGAARAQRWSLYWRNNISGYTSNISLGLMLGIIPPVAAFFGLPIEVRHVTLSTGQLAAAVGSEGFAVTLFQESAFWWCLAGIAVTGVLNLSVSFLLAFKVALRSRGIRLRDRSRIYKAIGRRLWARPLSFIAPPRRS
jgi:site-specific recombinase